jgi:hypothetical protein
LCKRLVAMKCNVIVNETNTDDWTFKNENFIARYANLCYKEIYCNTGN